MLDFGGLSKRSLDFLLGQLFGGLKLFDHVIAMCTLKNPARFSCYFESTNFVFMIFTCWGGFQFVATKWLEKIKL